MLALTPLDQKIAERLAVELADVEARFSAELLSELDCVNSLVEHIERYRGKMLRPTLVLASGLACSADGDTVTEAHRVIATVVEIVHMATLVHDDVLDEADHRRRGATVNNLEGNEAAVMLGDYLISHAYHLSSSLGSQAVSRMIAQTTNTVCEGELLQLANRNNFRLEEATYFEIIRRKTASLCGVCGQLGAMLHAEGTAMMQALYDFGEKAGLAFQIVDDLLDLMGQEKTVGKSLGRDLVKGKPTLPLIHYLATAPEFAQAAMTGLIEDVQRDGVEASEPEVLPAIRDRLREGGSVDYANEVAERLIRQSHESLSTLSPSPARQFLGELADAVLTRRF